MESLDIKKITFNKNVDPHIIIIHLQIEQEMAVFL